MLVGWVVSLFLHFYYSIKYNWYVIKKYPDMPELRIWFPPKFRNNLNKILNGIDIEDDIAQSLWRKGWVAGSFLLFFWVVLAFLVYALSF